MDTLQKQEGESNLDHYQRLLALREALTPAIREAKRQASADANRKEADRRHARDVAKAEAMRSEGDASGE